MAQSHPDQRRIFLAAREIEDEQQRSAYLEEACAGDAALRARVEALITAAEIEDGFLEPAPEAGAAAIELRMPAEKPGDVIGRYKLLEQNHGRVHGRPGIPRESGRSR